MLSFKYKNDKILQKTPVSKEEKLMSLYELLDLNDFEQLQAELSKIVNLSLITTDIEGLPIAPFSNFTSFCQLIRSSDKGRESCIFCDQQALKRALHAKRPLVYTCHCGLIDCAAPIILDRVPIGGVLGGQVLICEEDRKKIDTQVLAKKFQLDKSALDKAVADIQIVTEERIQLCLDFYTFFAEYIAEKGLQTITQQQLFAEKMERIRQHQIATEQLLKRLQAQMNPHFLFNALNSIARMALIEGASETEQLIYDLSGYLRYTIKNKSDTPTIEEELDNLRHYLNIQNLRFGDKITVRIQIDENLKEYRIPSLTLQPLVENCIIHGLKDCMENGLIEISISYWNQKKDIMIEIYDNGTGIPKDIMDKFNSISDFSADSSGLGLFNTHLRIKKMYGAEYGITIDSKPQEYTRLKVLIPATR